MEEQKKVLDIQKTLESYVEDLKTYDEQGDLMGFIDNFVIDGRLEIGFDGGLENIILILAVGGPLIEYNLGQSLVEAWWADVDLTAYVPREISNHMWDICSELYYQRLIRTDD